MRNQQILLGEVPKSKLGAEHFKLAESEVPKPAEGEVLVRVRLISLDAANRAWMQGATYRSAVTAGNVMAGGAVAEVVESRADKPITRLRCIARRQDGTEVLRGECLVYTMRPDGPSRPVG